MSDYPKNKNITEVIKMQNGDVCFQLELDTGVVFAKVADVHSKHGNAPVELIADEAREIGEKFIEMADRLEAYDK